MLMFILRRVGTIILTMFCLTLVVFYLVNLEPNLEKVAKREGNNRMTDAEVATWLERNGYTRGYFVRYGEWLGVVPGWTRVDEETGQIFGRCISRDESRPPEGADAAAHFEEVAGQRCGLLQGQFGTSLRFQKPVGELLPEYLANTGILMLWVMIVMVPGALIIGVLAGMREGSKLDRSLSVASITSTSAPEYVTGIVFAVLFASLFKQWGQELSWWPEWFHLNASAASATSSRGDGVTFYNFALPVMTMALYGMGYIARMTRASMAEVMTSQYIRTARLKGLNFRTVVMRHALRNALIAPFTVIMLQFPWLLTGVVIVEAMFGYKGFGWMLVEAAGNNDVELLMSISMVAVVIVLMTQLISDIGYAYLNPRIRVR